MKKIVFLLIVIVCIIIINGLARSIYNLWHKQDLVVNAQKNLDKEKIENEKLKQELSRVKSPQFIESEARNKLFMVKPGESGVIIPSSLTQVKPTPTPMLPNWRKWANLFIKGS